MSPIDRLREQAFLLYLRWRGRPAVVRTALDRLKIARTPNCDALPSDSIRVAAIQMRLHLVGGASEYAEMIGSRAKDAAAEGAQLVVFPEDSGTHLVGMLPGLAGLGDGVSLAEATAALAGPGARPADVLRFVGPAVRSIYETTFSEVARRLGVYIASGSAMLPDEDGAVRNIGYLFGPDGRVLCRQVKCHLMPLEAAWGLWPGDDLHVAVTPLAAIGLPICMDATYFETSRILAGLGAELILIPACDVYEDRAVGPGRTGEGEPAAPYNAWKALRGLWPRVQESQTFGVHAAMVGGMLGMTVAGRSAILAPLELTADGSGIVAQASSWDQEEIVVGGLDRRALRELWKCADVADGFNVELYRQHFPAAYAAYRARHAEGRTLTIP
jgi:predicted amidohydrolase